MDQQPRKRLLCVGSRINGVWDVRHAGISGRFSLLPPARTPATRVHRVETAGWGSSLLSPPGQEPAPTQCQATSTNIRKKGEHHERA